MRAHEPADERRLPVLKATLRHNGIAFMRSFECTFCEGCATGMHYLCPNCGGEPIRRPGRGEGGS